LKLHLLKQSHLLKHSGSVRIATIAGEQGRTKIALIKYIYLDYEGIRVTST